MVPVTRVEGYVNANDSTLTGNLADDPQIKSGHSGATVYSKMKTRHQRSQISLVESISPNLYFF